MKLKTISIDLCCNSKLMLTPVNQIMDMTMYEELGKVIYYVAVLVMTLFYLG
jgi:hypothetical protein